MGNSITTAAIPISSTKPRYLSVTILVAIASHGGFAELATGEEQTPWRVEQDAITPVQLAQAEQVYELDIPSQSLADALAEFSTQTGIQVQGARIAPDAQSSGVTGTYSPGQALQILLSGTGLTYRFADANTVTLEQASLEQDEGPVVLDDGVVQLEEITGAWRRRSPTFQARCRSWRKRRSKSDRSRARSGSGSQPHGTRI